MFTAVFPYGILSKCTSNTQLEVEIFGGKEEVRQMVKLGAKRAVIKDSHNLHCIVCGYGHGARIVALKPLSLAL